MGNNFPLDLLTPVRHVATELDRAAPAVLSVSDMAATYKHYNSGDVARVKGVFVGDVGESAVNRWFVEKAISELGRYVTSDGGGGFTLVTEFDKIRYKRRKLIRDAARDDSDTRRELRASMHAERIYHVEVIGERGGKKERALRLHKLARAFPTMTGSEFDAFVEDVRANGVNKPILVLDDEVLDGRHRVAVADALHIPVRVEEFTGTDEQAWSRVMSENVNRRHLTVAQRGLIVWEMYMPQAITEAEQRHGRPKSGGEKLESDGASFPDPGKAVEIAARRSSSLASSKTIERMRPVIDAPETKERIRRGDITTATEARREALAETSRHDEPADVITNFRPQTPFTHLGSALKRLQLALDGLNDTRTGGQLVDVSKFQDRLNEIRGLLGQINATLD